MKKGLPNLTFNQLLRMKNETDLPEEKKQEWIRPSELRIGNWVRHPHSDEIYQTEEISSTLMVRGIPLSPEWLERLGFKKEKTGGAGGQDQWAGLSAWSYKGEWIFRGEPSCLHLIGYFNTQIHTVHQLQNLYFCLTGQEIETRGCLLK